MEIKRGDKRPADGIGRAVVRAAAAVGAGVKIEHVLPGEILEVLDAEGVQIVELLRRLTPQRTGLTFPLSSFMKKTLGSEVIT